MGYSAWFPGALKLDEFRVQVYAVMTLELYAKKLPGLGAGRPVRAPQAFWGTAQLQSCRVVNVDAKTLVEPGHTGAVASVYPNPVIGRGDHNFKAVWPWP